MMSLSKSEAKTMNLLYGEQDFLYAAEIARKLNVPKRTIYDTVNSLERKGIVEKKLIGKMRFYKLTDEWRRVVGVAMDTVNKSSS